MKLFPLIADNWRLDGGIAFGMVPKAIWSRNLESDENNTIEITTRCLLIIHNERKILVDVGLGDKRSEKYYAFHYRQPGVSILNSLELLGFSANDITDVLFTHLHDDHVGAATRINENGSTVCVFENAHYWISRSQWEWAMNPNKRETAAYFKDNLLPLQESGRLTLLEEGMQPFEQVTLKMYNGHTHGQLIPFINTGDRTVVYMGDFIPSVANLPIPYVPPADIEPLVSMIEKEEFLEAAAENNYILIFVHDAVNECCSVMKSEKGVAVNKSFKLNEIQL